jgi:hypothetical protein
LWIRNAVSAPPVIPSLGLEAITGNGMLTTLTCFGESALVSGKGRLSLGTIEVQAASVNDSRRMVNFNSLITINEKKKWGRLLGPTR